METIHPKPFTLEGKEFGLKFTELLEKLRIRYPRAYNLRESIRRSTPLSLGKKLGILYEILQDNLEGYPKVHYVLWHNDELRQIYLSNEKAALIDGQGLFFISNGQKHYEKKVEHISIFRDIYDSPIEDIDNSEVYHHTLKSSSAHIPEEYHYAVDKINTLKISPYGLYALGKGYENKKSVFFIYNTGKPGSFFSGSAFEFLHLPSWLQSWQPGMEEGCMYASDETTIYKLMHRNSSTMVQYRLKDPNFRFGKTHTWQYSMFSLGSKFVIVDLHDSGNFLSHSDWINGYDGKLTKDDRWCPMGDSIMTVASYASGDIQLLHHTRTTNDYRWQKRKLFSANTQYQVNLYLKQAPGCGCYFGIDGEWFFITNNML